MAVVHGVESNVGYFEFKCDDGSWQQVNITNAQPLGSSANIDVIYLNPNQSLRFTLKHDVYWTTSEAENKSSVKFLAWDMTNGEHCGSAIVNVSTALSRRFLSKFDNAVTLIQLRKGCDGIPGSVGRFDAC